MMFRCLIGYWIAFYFGNMIFYFPIFIDTRFLAALFAKCLGKKTYFTGGIDSLDADYVSTRSYRIQVLFFKLCYWISNSCIVVSQSDLKNIVKCLSSRKKLSYSEHAIDTRLFYL